MSLVRTRFSHSMRVVTPAHCKQSVRLSRKTAEASWLKRIIAEASVFHYASFPWLLPPVKLAKPSQTNGPLSSADVWLHFRGRESFSLSCGLLRLPSDDFQIEHEDAVKDRNQKQRDERRHGKPAYLCITKGLP